MNQSKIHIQPDPKPSGYDNESVHAFFTNPYHTDPHARVNIFLTQDQMLTHHVKLSGHSDKVASYVNNHVNITVFGFKETDENQVNAVLAQYGSIDSTPSMILLGNNQVLKSCTISKCMLLAQTRNGYVYELVTLKQKYDTLVLDSIKFMQTLIKNNH